MLGLDASLDLWIGTFTGSEVASRKSVTRFLLIISGCIGLNSGLEEDREDLLLEVVDENVEGDGVSVMVRFLIERTRKSHIITCKITVSILCLVI